MVHHVRHLEEVIIERHSQVHGLGFEPKSLTYLKQTLDVCLSVPQVLCLCRISSCNNTVAQSSHRFALRSKNLAQIELRQKVELLFLECLRDHLLWFGNINHKVTTARAVSGVSVSLGEYVCQRGVAAEASRMGCHNWLVGSLMEDPAAVLRNCGIVRIQINADNLVSLYLFKWQWHSTLASSSDAVLSGYLLVP